MARSRQGLEEALEELPGLQEEFAGSVQVPGSLEGMNPALEYAARVEDFLEFAQLLCRDALERDESCGGHFRTEHQTGEGEARRDDERFAHVAAWEWRGEGRAPARHQEPLEYQEVEMSQRSYK